MASPTQPFHLPPSSETRGKCQAERQAHMAFISSSGLAPASSCSPHTRTRTHTALPWPKRSREALTLEVSHAEEEDADGTGHFPCGASNFPFHLGLHPVVNLLEVYSRVASEDSGPGPIRLLQRCNKAGFYSKFLRGSRSKISV